MAGITVPHISTPAIHVAAASASKVKVPVLTSTKFSKAKPLSLKAPTIKSAAIKPVNMKTPMVKFGAQMKTTVKPVKAVILKIPAMREAIASMKGGKISDLKGVSQP